MSSPLTPERAEFHKLELQMQNAASWQVLDSVFSQRDMVTRLHAGLFIVLSFLAGAKVRPWVLLAALAVGLVVVAVVAVSSTMLAEYNRGLQFLVYSAERYSRYVLAGDDAFFSSLIDVQGMPPLREQRDPMGYQVKALLAISGVDCFLAVGSIVLLTAHELGDGRSLVSTTGLLTGCVLGAGAAAATLTWLRLRIRAHERSITRAVETEFGRLGVGGGTP